MTIHILGLGESLQEFIRSHEFGAFKNDLTIGVNDIAAEFPAVDHVVCIDDPKAFNKERLDSILSTKCKGFYSQVESWKTIPNFKLLKFQSGRGIIRDLDSEETPYSISSPFVAAVIAYKLGAKEIVFHGVDFRTHVNFTDHRKEKALREIKELCVELIKKEVDCFVGSDWSELSRFLPIYLHKNQNSPDLLSS